MVAKVTMARHMAKKKAKIAKKNLGKLRKTKKKRY